MNSAKDEYARFSKIYDILIGPFLAPIHRDMQKTLVSGNCTSVIDLCCGTGLMAGMAANAGLTVTGVDLSPNMLSVARSKYPNISFIEKDATALPFSNDDFDAVTISFALHEKTAAIATGILNEAVRVVKPKGLIVVADYRQPEQQNARWTGWVISTIERLAGKEHAMHYNEFMNAGGTTGFLGERGFQTTPIMTYMHGWVGLYVHQKEQSATSMG